MPRSHETNCGKRDKTNVAHGIYGLDGGRALNCADCESDKENPLAVVVQGAAAGEHAKKCHSQRSLCEGHHGMCV